MRVFVTGASGHIASAVIPELLTNAHQVVGLDEVEAGVEPRAAHHPDPVGGFGVLDVGHSSPDPVRVNSGSSSSLRSAATCIETPASETPSSVAAARTEPKRTTAE